jgi:hypothetical protein
MVPTYPYRIKDASCGRHLLRQAHSRDPGRLAPGAALPRSSRSPWGQRPCTASAGQVAPLTVRAGPLPGQVVVLLAAERDDAQAALAHEG